MSNTRQKKSKLNSRGRDYSHCQTYSSDAGKKLQAKADSNNKLKSGGREQLRDYILRDIDIDIALTNSKRMTDLMLTDIDIRALEERVQNENHLRAIDIPEYDYEADQMLDSQFVMDPYPSVDHTNGPLQNHWAEEARMNRVEMERQAAHYQMAQEMLNHCFVPPNGDEPRPEAIPVQASRQGTNPYPSDDQYLPRAPDATATYHAREWNQPGQGWGEVELNSPGPTDPVMAHFTDQITRNMKGGKTLISEFGGNLDTLKSLEAIPAEQLKVMVHFIKKYKIEDIDKHKKSTNLLKEWLTEEEWKSLMENHYIDIPSKEKPGTVYRVSEDPMEKVLLYTYEFKKKRLCGIVDTQDDIPMADQLLAKITTIKNNEKYFLENVNEFEAYD